MPNHPKLRALTVVAFCVSATASAAQELPTPRSDVAGIAVTALGTLPAAPASAMAEGLCENHKRQPETTAGQAVRDMGWPVTSEAALGPFTVVSFAGAFEPATSGSCLLVDGNLGFFYEDALMALVYAQEAGAYTIGKVATLETGGLRIWDGDLLPGPVADITFGPEGEIVVTALAEAEYFCTGTRSVPLIYGLPLADAQDELAQHGWQPVDRAPDSPEDFIAAELADAGFAGVESCAGTGFGFCALQFTNPPAQADVVTAGDLNLPAGPMVTNYSVTCDRR